MAADGVEKGKGDDGDERERRRGLGYAASAMTLRYGTEEARLQEEGFHGRIGSDWSSSRPEHKMGS